MNRHRKRVLQDHKKTGSVLVTPFNHALGPLDEISWARTIVPEILWIALLQFRYGDHRGVKLVTTMARAARSLADSAAHNAFASNSSYDSLSPDDCVSVRRKLSDDDCLAWIQAALEPLVAWYPSIFLQVLFDQRRPEAKTEGLQAIKETVRRLRHRDERNSMMVQATAIWLAFDSGLLKISKGLALANFPEIEKYPNTDLSLQVGSGVRAGLNLLFGSRASGFTHDDWSSKFWDHGLFIDLCEFGDDS